MAATVEIAAVELPKEGVAAVPGASAEAWWRRGWRGAVGWARVIGRVNPADDATRRRRRQVCAACPAARGTRKAHRLTVLTPASTCGVCRCQLLAKTRLADEACPEGKW